MPKPKGSLGNRGDLHVKGYQIIRQAIDIDERVLPSAQGACAKESAAIFNHNESNPDE